MNYKKAKKLSGTIAVDPNALSDAEVSELGILPGYEKAIRQSERRKVLEEVTEIINGYINDPYTSDVVTEIENLKAEIDKLKDKTGVIKAEG